ncbi:hypothetical protein BD626DRAFT_396593 [Schizophyllum amplum]|uniref:Uncharacterized protein n=1 Tax=Schizophyllum amplum TaxID=97359 RepID=A0A550CP57_9AGAR|nr:hypothetical protein BD626DRAFT_396593 [Auriculariopsis ampla]
MPPDDADEILRNQSKTDEDHPRVLARILHVFFRERMQPLDPDIVSEEACRRLLAGHPALDSLIREAIDTESSTGLWNCELLKFRHVNLASFHSSFDRDHTARHAMEEILVKLRESISDFANGRSQLPTWAPPSSLGVLDDSDQTLLSALNIPQASDSNPCLALHDLGSMIDEQLLRDRLQNVFIAGNHTMLINASASGKTRLLFEGLCEHWGVYMPCAMDASGVGSHNLAWNILVGIEAHELFKSTPPWDMRHLYTNEGVAERIFQSCLLAGLVLLKTFLESIEPKDRHTFDARKRWLLLQTCTFSTDCGDVALALSDCIRHALPTYIKHAIADTLLNIRALLGRRDAPIFCVADECQVPDTKFAMNFRDEVTPLRLMAQSWESFDGVTVILTGTSINREPFCRPGLPQYQVCTDTGAFDTAERQKSYILRYLPPVLAASSTGQSLLTSMWTWLKGRYRFTAGFVSCLLMTWFKQPQMLLKAYVLAQFKIDANISDDELEGPLPYSSQRAVENFYGFTGASLESDPQAWYSSQYIMLRVLLGEDSVHISENGFLLARHGVAHFTDACGKESRAYEPTVLCPLARRIFKDSGVADGLYPMEMSKSIEEPPIHRTDHLAFASVLVHALRKERPLCDLFSFPAIAPEWAAQTAQLVRVVRQKGSNPQAIKVESSFANAKDHERWVSYSPRWLQQKSGEPFCVASQFSEADLLFVLQLKDGRCVYVALACVFRNAHVDVSLADVGRKLESLAPRNIFHQVPNTPYKNRLRFWALPESKATYMGDPPVLRVISAFPYEVEVNEIKRDVHPQPIATVNMSLFREVAGSISADDVVRRTTAVLGRTRGKKRKPTSEADAHDTKRPRTRATTKAESAKKSRSRQPPMGTLRRSSRLASAA